jgi:hypothetical protein
LSELVGELVRWRTTGAQLLCAVAVRIWHLRPGTVREPTEEGERPPFEATTKQRLVKT